MLHESMWKNCKFAWFLQLLIKTSLKISIKTGIFSNSFEPILFWWPLVILQSIGYWSALNVSYFKSFHSKTSLNYFSLVPYCLVTCVIASRVEHVVIAGAEVPVGEGAHILQALQNYFTAICYAVPQLVSVERVAKRETLDNILRKKRLNFMMVEKFEIFLFVKVPFNWS